MAESEESASSTTSEGDFISSDIVTKFLARGCDSLGKLDDKLIFIVLPRGSLLPASDGSARTTVAGGKSSHVK